MSPQQQRPSWVTAVLGMVLTVLMALVGYLNGRITELERRVNDLSMRQAALEAANTAEHRSMRADLREMKQGGTR